MFLEGLKAGKARVSIYKICYSSRNPDQWKEKDCVFLVSLFRSEERESPLQFSSHIIVSRTGQLPIFKPVAGKEMRYYD